MKRSMIVAAAICAMAAGTASAQDDTRAAVMSRLDRLEKQVQQLAVQQQAPFGGFHDRLQQLAGRFARPPVDQQHALAHECPALDRPRPVESVVSLHLSARTRSGVDQGPKFVTAQIGDAAHDDGAMPGLAVRKFHLAREEAVPVRSPR